MSNNGNQQSPSSTRAALAIDRVSHSYGKVGVLHDVSLSVEKGEFVTLLGPSGCGKSTLLRSIAGFLVPDSGRILLDGQDVTRTPPHKRDVNMVFQRPTLFPHLDVFENVSFGLSVDGVNKGDIGPRVAEALALVRLEGFERRRSSELSGGQMQRVALARALIKQPKVLLLDEPLSALDLKIRLEMEVELRRVHNETGATFVYVTHDQTEALALSDRIAVLNHGFIEQLDSPTEAYRRPSSAFAARFLGDANVIPIEVRSVLGAEIEVAVSSHLVRIEPEGGAAAKGLAQLVIRPETIEVTADAGASGVVPATVLDAAYRGWGYTYRVAVDGLEDPLKVEAVKNGMSRFEIGSRVGLTWDKRACVLLPASELDGKADQQPVLEPEESHDR